MFRTLGQTKLTRGLDTECLQSLVQNMDRQRVPQASSTDIVLSQVLRVKWQSMSGHSLWLEL